MAFCGGVRAQSGAAGFFCRPVAPPLGPHGFGGAFREVEIRVLRSGAPPLQKGAQFPQKWCPRCGGSASVAPDHCFYNVFGPSPRPPPDQCSFTVFFHTAFSNNNVKPMKNKKYKKMTGQETFLNFSLRFCSGSKNIVKKLREQ